MASNNVRANRSESESSHFSTEPPIPYNRSDSVRANRSESESSDSSMETPIPYNCPLTSKNFEYISPKMLAKVMNIKQLSDGTVRGEADTANEILANNQLRIRGYITEARPHQGQGSFTFHPRYCTYVARRFLNDLRRMKGDASAKLTMTHKEIYKSNIGSTLTAFRERTKECLVDARMRNRPNSNEFVCYFKFTLKNINDICKLLVEFEEGNFHGWTTEDLGLPEYEQNDGDSDSKDEDDEEDDGGSE